MMRKPRLRVFFLIDFSILSFKFSLIVILGSASVSVKDVQTYLYNLIEAEPEPKSNRASDTDNTDDADDTNNIKNIDDADVNNNNNTENADDADNADNAKNADNADNADNAENAENAENADDTDDTDDTENADCCSAPSPYHVTWPISRLPAPINFIYIQYPSSIVLKSNTPTRTNYKRQIE